MPRSRLARILVRSLVVVVVLVALAVGSVYAGYAWIMTKKHDAPLEPVLSAEAVSDTAEGRRVATLVGCMMGCHGPSGGGGMIEVPGLIKMSVPSLTEVLPRYTDAELARLLRYGVKRDRTTALVMPSGALYSLSNADLARAIAFLRSLPPAKPGPAPVRDLAFFARLGLVIGKFPTSVTLVDRSQPRWGELPRTTPVERGRYLASVTCTECHGLDFKGNEIMSSPSLEMVGGYDFEQFKHLLQTGEPLDRRKLGLMAEVATGRFVNLRDDEIADIYAFIRDKFGQPLAAHPSTRLLARADTR